jgi:hypothetical protein
MDRFFLVVIIGALAALISALLLLPRIPLF